MSYYYWNVPPFPTSLRDCIGGFVFSQLKKWRVHCSKKDYNATDEKKRLEWVFHKSPPGSNGDGKDHGRGRGKGDGNNKARGSRKNHHHNRDHCDRRGGWLFFSFPFS
jgi:hypothetical protein